jgi:intracellular multiplication protein IcmV
MKKTKDNKPPRKPWFNVRAWVGWDGISEGAKTIKTLASSLFVPAESTRTESFEDALARLQLTDDDILKQSKNFKRLFILFFIATIGLFVYAFTMLMTHAYVASLASFGLTALLFAQTFRYHFWWFQMKHRRLGCSFKEWFQQGVLGLTNKGVIQK